MKHFAGRPLDAVRLVEVQIMSGDHFDLAYHGGPQGGIDLTIQVGERRYLLLSHLLAAEARGGALGDQDWLLLEAAIHETTSALLTPPGTTAEALDSRGERSA